MNLIINNLMIPVEKDGTGEYIKAASEKLKICEDSVKLIKILGKTFNFSDKKQFYYEISLVITTPDHFDNKENFPVYTEKTIPESKKKTLTERPVIIGFGPAGIFATLILIEHGIKPLIFERGKKLEERSLDIQRFIETGDINPESNIQFGEGGAGSYSDGKLFSRINNSPYIEKVLNTFIKFGAPEKIGYISKPHLGTDVLCRVVKKIREFILDRGGEIEYLSKMTDITISNGKAVGVVINGNREYPSSRIYLATGHSARDTSTMLFQKGIYLTQRPISVGVRVEHPAEIINLIRYGDKYRNFPGIGAATYSFNFTDKKIGRGAYTFCMCPGGEILNASSEEGLLVINGMSSSDRASDFSNSAIVVTCRTEDYGATDPLAGVRFQKEIEKNAFNAGGGRWKVPAQNLSDFLSDKKSINLNENSYKMGAASVNIKDIFPEFVSKTLLAAFNKWREDYPLFVSEHAILLGAETRTSSPVKIMRNEKYESVNIKNLYPIGEGSGYTGGITSSAADAIKSVECSLKYI